MDQLIMALDQGTTSSRCILYNKQGEIVSLAQKEFTQFYPKPGWVEHDAMEIWSTQIGVAHEAMYKINASFQDICAIGITNQRETTVIWDKTTGEPVCNAIVWQCRRTAEYCDTLKRKGLTDQFRKKTGLPIDAYFSATKINWILEHVEGAKTRAQNGELLFGTIETWLIWKLTKGRVHVTDYSNASRTMLFNINTMEWDHEILEELDIPACILPEPKPSSHVYGVADSSIFWRRNTDIRSCGRSAGGLVRADLFFRRRSKKHLWNRLLSADEYWSETCFLRKRFGYHRCMGFGRNC